MPSKVDEIGFLEELVSIPSLSGGEDALAEHLEKGMSALRFRAQRDMVGNVIGVVGNPNAEREIALVGHMDTVAGLIPVVRKDGLLYGRGAVDAKGALAAFVLAAARVAPRLRTARVVVVGTVQEEGGGTGARHLAHTLSSPHFCIIGEPSGWEGITIGYKGMMSVDYQLTQPSGHGAGSQPTPAEQAVAFWNRLKSYTEARNAGLPGRFDTLDASLQGFVTSTDGLKDRASMNIALRVPPGFELSSVERAAETWQGTARLAFRSSYPPIRVGKNTPPVRALLRAIRAEGGKPRFKLKTGTSDMNLLGPAWGCPIVAFGPGDSALDHTPDEHIDLDEFRRAVGVLARTLEILCVESD